jgi:alpha-glucosidase (family GH31 glycosyl hydrolase)
MTYEGYEAYDRGVREGLFIKDIQGNNYLGQVWPGPTYFPDFLNPNTQSYWTDQMKDFLSLANADGIWIDMNEVSMICIHRFDVDLFIFSLLFRFQISVIVMDMVKSVSILATVHVPVITHKWFAA